MSYVTKIGLLLYMYFSVRQHYKLNFKTASQYFISQIVLYFLHSTLVLSFYIDVVLTLSIIIILRALYTNTIMLISKVFVILCWFHWLCRMGQYIDSLRRSFSDDWFSFTDIDSCQRFYVVSSGFLLHQLLLLFYLLSICVLSDVLYEHMMCSVRNTPTNNFI